MTNKYDDIKEMKDEIEKRFGQKLPTPLPTRLQILWAALKDYLLQLLRRR